MTESDLATHRRVSALARHSARRRVRPPCRRARYAGHPGNARVLRSKASIPRGSRRGRSAWAPSIRRPSSSSAASRRPARGTSSSTPRCRRCRAPPSECGASRSMTRGTRSPRNLCCGPRARPRSRSRPSTAARPGCSSPRSATGRNATTTTMVACADSCTPAIARRPCRRSGPVIGTAGAAARTVGQVAGYDSLKDSSLVTGRLACRRTTLDEQTGSA